MHTKKRGHLLPSLFFLFSLLCITKDVKSQTTSINISAAVVAGWTCWFQTSNATINLGNLTPGTGLDISGTATLNFRCIGFDTLSYSITDDDGLYEASPGMHRMKHSTLNEYIDYNFTYSPQSETIIRRNRIINIRRTLNITATALHSSYQNASIGSYSDTVTLTLLP